MRHDGTWAAAIRGGPFLVVVGLILYFGPSDPNRVLALEVIAVAIMIAGGLWVIGAAAVALVRRRRAASDLAVGEVANSGPSRSRPGPDRSARRG